MLFGNKLKKIYCVGDSHTSIFSGYNKILPLAPNTQKRYSLLEPYRLGAVLAYNIQQKETSTHGLEKFNELVNSVIPPKANILLVFGEIDCRVHIVSQAHKQNVSIEKIVRNTINRYLEFITELKKQNFNLIICGVLPTTTLQSTNMDFPTSGTIEERTQATLLFNKGLKAICENGNIQYLSIYDYVINTNGFMNEYYFIDGYHLSNNALPFFFKELRLPKYYFILYWFYKLLDQVSYFFRTKRS